VQAALQQRSALVHLDVRLSLPIVALGAAAGTYYPEVARQLNTSAVIPTHADVANAIGAVVGHVRVTSTILISRPSEDCYRVHLEGGPKDFPELDQAIAAAEQASQDAVRRGAEANGAIRIDLHLRHERKAITVGTQELFLEMTVTAVGTGRPSLAS
jgi:N-methylhydantoinase A/oxoprolinase/acetone carboxylase beta subunit